MSRRGATDTRDRLLDGVERLMLEKGYAGVSYRAVAATAGVTGGLVQYYFPTLDDLLVASVQRYFERNLDRLRRTLARGSDHPLTDLWRYSHDEATAALINEYMALGNHHPRVRAVLSEVTGQVRDLQLSAIGHLADTDDDSPTAAALLFLITGVPKLLQMEEALGVTTGHADIDAYFTRLLERIERRAGTADGA